ncbi:disease resistance protein rpp13 [Fagus crenata]
MALPLGVEVVFAAKIIEALVVEFDERRESKLRDQLGLLDRELRFVLAVLNHIESSKEPDGDMTQWALEANDVIRSVEDMSDTFMMTSGERGGPEILIRYVLYFNDMFLGSKIKSLMHRINTLCKKSKLLKTGKYGGEECKVNTTSSVITSAPRIFEGSYLRHTLLTIPILNHLETFPIANPLALDCLRRSA